MTRPSFILSEEDIKALLSYFTRAGYISYEFDMSVIILIKKMKVYMEEIE